VQVWLGHSDPAFTLRVYVHLLDDGLSDADFLDGASGQLGPQWRYMSHAKASKSRSRAQAESVKWLIIRRF
jgi:hypothetical protein